MNPVIHLRSLRHYNNAGISIPECCANRQFLNLDRTRATMTTDISQVTCTRCTRIINNGTVTRPE